MLAGATEVLGEDGARRLLRSVVEVDRCDKLTIDADGRDTTVGAPGRQQLEDRAGERERGLGALLRQIGRASCRERV